MSATDTGRPPAGAPPDASRFGTIVVIGGGCYGSYYVRQLRRAREAGAAGWEQVIVVDRDPDCRLAGELASSRDDTIRLEVAEWEGFIARHLAAVRNTTGRPDAIVPSPLMPHLLFDWVLDRARFRWPERDVRRLPLEHPPPVPWQRGSESGTHYVSFAEWMCPINCIEPRLCPAIRGPRTWSLPPAVRAYVDAERARGVPLTGPLLFHCTHRTHGVGMIDVGDVLAADAAVAKAGTAGRARVLIGTVSHCHGALDVLGIQ